MSVSLGRSTSRPSTCQLKALNDRQLQAVIEIASTEQFRRRLQAARKEGRASLLMDPDGNLAQALLAACKAQVADLEALLEGVNESRAYIDGLYRFYHYSFKVFHLQGLSLKIRERLQGLMPDLPLNDLFEEVVRLGTEHRFSNRTNAAWLPEALPITAAFFHARYFLEMAIRCAKRYERVDNLLGYDIAGLLYLFNLR